MIEFDNVSCRLGDQKFLFSVQIATNSLTIIAGESGSGKTTFLNLLAGFEIPDSGSVSVDRENMLKYSPGERPVSLVFQDNNLFSHLTVESNIGLGLRPSLFLSSAERERVSVALADVGLTGFEKRMPQTLSGGERQRVAFARALVRKKSVLALDEPFAALDPGMRRDMGQLLLQLHKRELNTVVMVSHNPDDVFSLASHVIFLDKGQAVFSGSVTEFAAKQDNDQIVRFLEGETSP